MDKVMRIQTAPIIDQITEDGRELTQLPYPFYADREGRIERQDFWKGTPLMVVGFQKDLAKQHIDLWWEAAYASPASAVGMYLVTRDADGTMSVHTTAVRDFAPID